MTSSSLPTKVHRVPEPAVREIDNLWIPLSDGSRLSARLWLPPEGDVDPVPAVVEVSPYRQGDHTRRRDSVRHPYFAKRGYASLRIDIRGSGASDGVLNDEYSEREQQDVCEALAWVAAQPWSTGSVGMIGLSWGGFAALQAAARKPPELKAVVVVCASADRYGADVKYRGGCLLGCELLPWSSTMLAMSVRPPDTALAGEGWRELWLERLEEATPFAELGSPTSAGTITGARARRARTTLRSPVLCTSSAAGPTRTAKPSSTCSRASRARAWA